MTSLTRRTVDTYHSGRRYVRRQCRVEATRKRAEERCEHGFIARIAEAAVALDNHAPVENLLDVGSTQTPTELAQIQRDRCR